MHVLLLPGPTRDVDKVRESLLAARPDAHVDVCGADGAVAWLAGSAPCDMVVVDDVHLEDGGTRLLPALRAQRPGLPIAVLVAAGDAPAEARALLAGADASVAADGHGLSQLAALLMQNRRRDVHAQRRGWRLWFAGRDTELRRQMAEQLGNRVLLMSLSADGRLVPKLEDPSAATALIVDAREKPGDMLLGLRRVLEAHPSLATVVVADENHHVAFFGLGVDDCLPPTVDVERVLLTVDRLVSARNLAAEVVALRARENRLRALVEYLPDPVVLVSSARTVLAVNLAGLELLGADEAQHVIGRELSGWLAPDDGGSLEAFVDAVSSGKAVEQRAATRHTSGPRPVVLRGVPFQREAGKPASVLVVIHDALVDAASSATTDGDDVRLAAAMQELDALRAQLTALSDEVRLAREAAQLAERRGLDAEVAARAREEEERRQLELTASLQHDLDLERLRAAETTEATRTATQALEHLLADEHARANLLVDLVARTREALATAQTQHHDELQAAAEEGQRLRDQVAALEQQLGTATHDRDALATQLRETLDTLADAQQRLTTLEAGQADVAALEHSLVEAREALAAAQAAHHDQLRTAGEEGQRLRDQLQAADDERQQLRDQVVALDARLAAVADEHAAREASLQSRLEESDARLAASADTAQALADLRVDREGLMDALAAAQHDASVQGAAHVEAAQRADVLAARVTQLEREHAERLAVLALERDELRRDAAQLQELRAELPALREAQRRVTALEGQLSETQMVKAQALALETEVSELRDAREHARRLESELASVRAELEAHPQPPATLEAAVDEETRWLLYEVASIGHLTTTPDARILGANDMAAQLLGHFSRDALQASGRLPDPLLQAAGAFAHRPTRFEVCLQHGDDGPLHWIVGLATPHAGVPATVTWMLIDVSEQRLQARRSRFLRRMEAMTHVLSAATAESSVLLDRMRPLLEAASGELSARKDLDVEGARTALARTHAILTQLSGFARKRARRAGVRDLRALLDEASPVLVHVAGEDISCTIQVAPGPLHATIEPAEFEQFLTALVMAGRDALPLGGRLTLEATAVNTDTRDEGTFFTRPSIELTLRAEGYGAQMPEGVGALQEHAQRLGGVLAAEFDGRGEFRTVVRLARVFVMQ